jgi:hypothetical protein
MIHLSVAIGRFVEALFWAIMHVAGLITLVVVGGAALIAGLVGVARLLLRRRPRG